MTEYDRLLIPPDEPERWWAVTVTITREYEGSFFGTQDGAEEAAKQSFKQHDRDFIDETIEAESEKEEK